MNMKKDFFDVKLFLDGFKQLKMLGIMGLIVSLLQAVLIPVGEFISLYSSENLQKTIVDYNITGILLAVCCFILAPVMTLYIFKFVNKRSGSDFYHSIPNKRSSVFISFTMSVIAWIIVIALSTFAVSAILYSGIFSKYFIFDLISSSAFVLSIFVGSVFLIGAVSIAISLTGTMFTNVIVSGLIIFLPRLFMLVCNQMIGDIQPVVKGINIIPFSDSEYNIITNAVTSLFMGNGDQFFNSFLSLRGCAYTGIVGVIYLVLACLIFNKRKSEMASKSAPNRIMQGVFRIIVTMVVCIIPCYIIVSGLDYLDSWFLLLVLYIIAIFVYFIYELITTKKWENLVKSLPGLAVVAALNVVFILGVNGAGKAIESTVPKSSEIKSISLINLRDVVDGKENYFSNYMKKIDFDDDKICAMTSEYLTNFIKEERENGDQILHDYRYQILPVEINMSGRSIKRNIAIPQNEVSKFLKEIKANEELKDIFLNLPSMDNKWTVAYVDDLSNEDSEKIYKVFCEEVREIGYDKWFEMVSPIPVSDSEIEFGRSYGYMRVRTKTGLKDTGFELYIGKNLPKTLNVCFEVNNKNIDEANDLFENLIADKDNLDIHYINMGVANFGDLDGDYGWDAYDYRTGEEKKISDNAFFTEILGKLSKINEKSIDINKPIIIINLNAWSPDSSESYFYNVAYNVDSDFLGKDMTADDIMQELLK